jgi:hypothetical protein
MSATRSTSINSLASLEIRRKPTRTEIQPTNTQYLSSSWLSAVRSFNNSSFSAINASGGSYALPTLIQSTSTAPSLTSHQPLCRLRLHSCVDCTHGRLACIEAEFIVCRQSTT